MLASESFTAYRTYEGPLVRMGPEVRPQVIGSCEAFGTQCALEGCWMFLNSLRAACTALTLRTRAVVVGVCQAKRNCVVWNRRSRLPSSIGRYSRAIQWRKRARRFPAVCSKIGRKASRVPWPKHSPTAAVVVWICHGTLTVYFPTWQSKSAV